MAVAAEPRSRRLRRNERQLIRIDLRRLNKIDLRAWHGGPERLAISAKTGEGSTGWSRRCRRGRPTWTEASAASPLMTRARHRDELEAAQAALLRFGDPALSPELKAEELRIAARLSAGSPAGSTSRTCWATSSPSSASANRAGRSPVFHVKQWTPNARSDYLRRMSKGFDVIVIGGGHAGCEAAAAAARMGARTALLTHASRPSARCPATRRSAAWARATGPRDRRARRPDGPRRRRRRHPVPLLNRSKGPAVQGPRAQADRKLYRQAMQAAIRATPDLEVIEAAVEDLIVERRWNGALTVWLTACYRRRPRIRGRRRGADHRHVPARPHPPRRAADPGRPRRRGPGPRPVRPALRLGPAHSGRLKTGTPPRLDGRTIDWARPGGAARRRPAACRSRS